MFILIIPFLSSVEENGVRELPFKIWTPFNANGLSYWLIFIYEALVSTTTVGITITNDCLLGGYMHQGCAQIDILTNRFKNFNDLLVEKKKERLNSDDTVELENNFFKDFIKHHVLIYK